MKILLLKEALNSQLGHWLNHSNLKKNRCVSKCIRFLVYQKTMLPKYAIFKMRCHLFSGNLISTALAFKGTVEFHQIQQILRRSVSHLTSPIRLASGSQLSFPHKYGIQCDHFDTDIFPVLGFRKKQGTSDVRVDRLPFSIKYVPSENCQGTRTQENLT